MSAEAVVRWSDPEAAAEAVVGSWAELAGPRLAAEVATGALCDRCARRALATVGLAGGVGPARIARLVLVPYARTLIELAGGER